MVEIRIIVEGGVVDTQNQDLETLNNNNAFRQSFHRIFSQITGNEVSIKIDNGGGYRNALRMFQKDDHAMLFVDLDDKAAHKDRWFAKVEPDFQFTPQQKERIFFMIQEMEAWMLKQPLAIERWGDDQLWVRVNSKEIAQDERICNKDIELIRKPSQVIKHIIKDFFQTSKRKPIEYGKLKHAPGLLDALEISTLEQTDAEIRRWKSASLNISS